MKNGMILCADSIAEVERKLTAILPTIQEDPSAKARILEALGFVAQARKAIMEAQTKVNAIKD